MSIKKEINKLKKITKFSLEIDNTKKSQDKTISYEGFQVDKDFISALSKKKEESSATTLAITYVNCKTIGGNTFAMLFLSDKSKLTQEEILACQVLGIKL